jgi:hypothetical protein
MNKCVTKMREVLLNNPAAMSLVGAEKTALITRLYEHMVDKNNENKTAEKIKNMLKYDRSPASLMEFVRGYVNIYEDLRAATMLTATLYPAIQDVSTSRKVKYSTNERTEKSANNHKQFRNNENNNTGT